MIIDKVRARLVKFSRRPARVPSKPTFGHLRALHGTSRPSAEFESRRWQFECCKPRCGNNRPTYSFGSQCRPIAAQLEITMKALCWHGTNDIRCDSVPDPKIEDGRDVIVKVTSCAICGSDLHLMDGLMPTMKSGDILGHEFMGEVIETGSAHNKFRKGDRIVVPFNINCGECRQCKLGNYSVCQRSNRNAAMAAAQFGYTTAGLFGYSHLTGGYAGGQAEYVRVPMADVAPMKVPDGMTDEEVLFLTDIFPTGYQAAEQAGIKGGEIVAIWGRVPLVCSRSNPPRCLAQSASSPSRPYRSGSPWREGPAPPTSSTLRKRTSSNGSRRSARAKAPMS